MAVTNYREIAITPYNGGNADKPKIGVGSGIPDDTAFLDDKNQPIDSVYINRDNGTIYVKKSAGTWQENSPVA
jgi:hypothetical protein